MNGSQPSFSRAILTWSVFIVLLSGAGLVVSQPGTASFVLSGVMLAVGLVFGVVLFAVLRRWR